MKTEETLLLKISSRKIFPKNVDGKLYVYFEGASASLREPGKRKEWVALRRRCFCDGSVWAIFGQVKDCGAMSLDEYRAAEAKMLRPFKNVKVVGYLDEEMFGSKGFHATNVEVINEVKPTEPIHLGPGGFIEDVEF